MNKKLVVPSVLLMASLTAGAAWYWPFGREPELLRLPGLVEIQEVRLASRVGGRVKSVSATEGELVTYGRPLVTLDSSELEARREQIQAQLKAAEASWEKARIGPREQEKTAARETARAAEARWRRLESGYRPEEVEQARGDLESLEAELARADRELAREIRLDSRGVSADAHVDSAQMTRRRLEGLTRAARARLKMLEAGSRPEEITEAEAEWARAKANHELLVAGTRAEEKAEAEARVKELQARLREIEVSLTEAVILAPEEVVVEVMGVRPGDVVAPNQPVVRVLRAADLWVKAYVPETELGRLRLGQEVEVTVDSYPKHRFSGKIQQIASTSEFTPRNVQSVDERRHQVFGIKVRVADPQGVFKSGMAAEVLVPLQSAP